MFTVYAHVSSLVRLETYVRFVHMFTHMHTHIHTHFPDKAAGSIYTISEKSSTLKKFALLLQSTYLYLYSYHLATVQTSYNLNRTRKRHAAKTCVTRMGMQNSNFVCACVCYPRCYH